MKPFDLNAYDKRVFGAIEKLIHERDPSLGEDEIKREALHLMGDHVRAASVLSLLGPISKRSDLEQLKGKSREFVDALENLSPQSHIELRYLSGSTPLPDLKRLQLDAEELSNALWEGLKKRPPPKQNRPKDVTMAILVEEAVNVFEKATGTSLNDLTEPKSQISKNIIHKLNQFVRTYMPEDYKYSSESQFKSLSKMVSRYRIDRRKR